MLDGVVNGAGRASSKTGAGVVYDNIDQGVVDGVVNGSGHGAASGGQCLRRIQTGQVQQYAASSSPARRSSPRRLVVHRRQSEPDRIQP